MFSYENFTTFYDAIAYMLFPIYILSLLIAWKNINTRLLIFILLIVELIDSAMYKTALTFGNYYFLWSILMCLLFIVPVICRRLIAIKLIDKHIFFKSVIDNYYFTKQEGALLFLYSVSFVINAVTYIEGVLYYHYVIDSGPIRENLYAPIQSIVHMLVGIQVLLLANKFKGKRYENYSKTIT